MRLLLYAQKDAATHKNTCNNDKICRITQKIESLKAQKLTLSGIFF